MEVQPYPLQPQCCTCLHSGTYHMNKGECLIRDCKCALYAEFAEPKVGTSALREGAE